MMDTYRATENESLELSPIARYKASIRSLRLAGVTSALSCVCVVIIDISNARRGCTVLDNKANIVFRAEMNHTRCIPH